MVNFISMAHADILNPPINNILIVNPAPMDAFKIVIKEKNKYTPLIKYYPSHLKSIMGVLHKKSFTSYRLGKTYALKHYDTCPVIVCSQGYHLFKEPVRPYEQFSREVFDALMQQNKLGYLKILRCSIHQNDVLAQNKIKVRVRKFKVLGEYNETN